MTEYNLTLEEAKEAMKAGCAAIQRGGLIDYFYSKMRDDFYFITHEFIPCFYIGEDGTNQWRISLTKREVQEIKKRTFKDLNKWAITFYLECEEDDETNGD